MPYYCVTIDEAEKTADIILNTLGFRSKTNDPDFDPFLRNGVLFYPPEYIKGLFYFSSKYLLHLMLRRQNWYKHKSCSAFSGDLSRKGYSEQKHIPDWGSYKKKTSEFIDAVSQVIRKTEVFDEGLRITGRVESWDGNEGKIYIDDCSPYGHTALSAHFSGNQLPSDEIGEVKVGTILPTFRT